MRLLYFKTSYVDIKLKGGIRMADKEYYFKTSYVDIKLTLKVL